MQDLLRQQIWLFATQQLLKNFLIVYTEEGEGGKAPIERERLHGRKRFISLLPCAFCFLIRSTFLQRRLFFLRVNEDFFFSRQQNFHISAAKRRGRVLWGKLSTADRSAKTLQVFTNYIRKRDITRLMDSRCKGCFPCCT